MVREKPNFQLHIKLKIFWKNFSERVCGAFVNLEAPIKLASDEMDVIQKLKSESLVLMDLEKNFETIDSLNELRKKMENWILKQKQIILDEKYEEYKNTRVKIENAQSKIEFRIKISELENARKEKIKFKNAGCSYNLSISRSKNSEDGFDVYFGISEGVKNGCLIIPKIRLKPFTDSWIVMGSLDGVLSPDQNEVKAAKILILQSDTLKSNQELVITIEIEEVYLVKIY